MKNYEYKNKNYELLRLRGTHTSSLLITRSTISMNSVLHYDFAELMTNVPDFLFFFVNCSFVWVKWTILELPSFLIASYEDNFFKNMNKKKQSSKIINTNNFVFMKHNSILLYIITFEKRILLACYILLSSLLQYFYKILFIGVNIKLLAAD